MRVNLLTVVFFIILKQISISADDTNIKNVVERFHAQIDEMKKNITNIIKLDDDIKKDLPTILNEKVSTVLEKYVTTALEQISLSLGEGESYLSTECETLFNSKYNSSKNEIYHKLHGIIVGYYDEVKLVLTTRFEEELKEFERRVNQLLVSSHEVDLLTEKMDGASELISKIEKAQYDVIENKTLEYFREEASADFVSHNLIEPFTECLDKTLKKQ